MAAPTQIAYRYAKSLIEMASETNKLEAIKNDIDLFNETTKNRDFALLLKSPIVNKGKKLEVLHALFGDKMDDLTLSFFKILTRKSREDGLIDIGKSFIEQYNTLNAITKVKLTTSAVVDESFIKNVLDKLKANGVSGNIKIEKNIDPSIIGGFILQMGDKLFDSSLKRKIELMRNELINS